MRLGTKVLDSSTMSCVGDQHDRSAVNTMHDPNNSTCQNVTITDVKDEQKTLLKANQNLASSELTNKILDNY